MSAGDVPPLAMYSPPPVYRTHSISNAPRHFLARSLKNLRHGNPTLFVVFCGCLIIFLRALTGAGYDEAYSAHADALQQKHPSILARWGPHSQQMLEQRWKSLRKSSGQGLWGKIKKEDEGVSRHLLGQHPGEDAMHWLRVMESKAMAGLARRAVPDMAIAAGHGAESGAVPAAPAPVLAAPQIPQAVVADASPPPPPAAPELDPSHNLDQHSTPAVQPAATSTDADALSVDVAPIHAQSDSIAASPLDSEVHAKHEDLADVPVFS